MEEQLLAVLADTQQPDAARRHHAEQQLEQLSTNSTFPVSLVSVAAAESVPLNLRQSALLVLKTYVAKSWAHSLDDFEGRVLISDLDKSQVRNQLLNILTNGANDWKIKAIAGKIIRDIAIADYPQRWPELLSTLLNLAPSADDDQLHGVLIALSQLVADGLSEEHFFASAREIMSCLYGVVVHQARKPKLKALALLIFRGCYDMFEKVAQVHGADVRGFVSENMRAWSPILIQALTFSLPPMSVNDEEYEVTSAWQGSIAFKIQAAKAFEKVLKGFPTVLISDNLSIFSAICEALAAQLTSFIALYVEDDRQSRLEDADGLPYTLDFLALEQIDLLKSLFGLKSLKSHLINWIEHGSFQEKGWVVEIVKLLVEYSQITDEQACTWEYDVNTFLSEEGTESMNFTARVASVEAADQLANWLPQRSLEGLLVYVQSVFQIDSSGRNWRSEEACLFILTCLAAVFHNRDLSFESGKATEYSKYVEYAMKSENQFLRSRGYTVAGALVKASQNPSDLQANVMMQRSLTALSEDPSEIVKVSCIRVLKDYVVSMRGQAQGFQIPIITALSGYLEAHSSDEWEDQEELLNTMIETLRDAIQIEPNVCLESSALDPLIAIASHGAGNMQTVEIAQEAFQDIAQAIADQSFAAYNKLCTIVLPQLISAFDLGEMENNADKVETAAGFIKILAEEGTSPLPQGIIAAILPKLRRLLFSDADFSLHQLATETIKFMLAKDPSQLFSWRDSHDGKDGLEVLLVIVDRLLGPDVDDVSAAEVGGLAAELVEKAGFERLGPYLGSLLRTVAIRLSTAEHSQLIQSLVLVFAKLAQDNAQEIVNFLEQVRMDGLESLNGLEIVMRKWLENSINFSGYDNIRMNIMALSNIYNLHDERLSMIHVHGDMITPSSDRIWTRSRAKAEPEQYTVISASVKLIKVLVAELLLNSPPRHGSSNGTSDADEDSDDEWEDEPAMLDLAAPITKEGLMGWIDESKWTARKTDDVTQAYLAEFFRNIAQSRRQDFQALYQALNDSEQAKLLALWQN